MVVRFLSKSGSFKGVSYNTRKVDKKKGELMKVSGFGPLQGMQGLRPKDYINYMKAVSAQNKRVKLPQLHVAISAKGRSHGKEELTSIAENWLKEMGYGDQPYLIIFHKDTANNHVHVVSTRVAKDGKKINSAYERVRAMTAINKVLKMDEKEMARMEFETALRYAFSTKPQFKLLLESKGYEVSESGEELKLIKFGQVLLEAKRSDLTAQINDYQINPDRQKQLTAIFHDYALKFSTALVEDTISLPGGLEKPKASYRSDFGDVLKSKFGIELIFHGAPGKPAYGYTILDHAKQHVYKGGEVMDIQVLLDIQVEKTERVASEFILVAAQETPGAGPVTVKWAEDVSPLDTELNIDVGSDRFIDLQSDNNQFSSQFSHSSSEAANNEFDATIDISISDDVDDEAIHGRNRHRKGQVRTNTR
jgi:hypothetical protein